jgi:hypothetical protein
MSGRGWKARIPKSFQPTPSPASRPLSDPIPVCTPKKNKSTAGQTPLWINNAGRKFTQLRRPPPRSRNSKAESSSLVDDWSVNPFSNAELVDISSTNNTQGRRKKERQWSRWKNEILPLLLGPYMAYLESTESLRLHPKQTRFSVCTCNEAPRVLEIFVVSFISAHYTSVRTARDISYRLQT